MRPKLTKRNFAICHLRVKQGFLLKELADMFKTTKSNICHILERHLKEYLSTIDKMNAIDIMELHKGRKQTKNK